MSEFNLIGKGKADDTGTDIYVKSFKGPEQWSPYASNMLHTNIFILATSLH
jgi:hypothetical protein